MRVLGEKEGEVRGVNTEEALHLGDRRQKRKVKSGEEPGKHCCHTRTVFEV